MHLLLVIVLVLLAVAALSWATIRVLRFTCIELPKRMTQGKKKREISLAAWPFPAALEAPAAPSSGAH